MQRQFGMKILSSKLYEFLCDNLRRDLTLNVKIRDASVIFKSLGVLSKIVKTLRKVYEKI